MNLNIWNLFWCEWVFGLNKLFFWIYFFLSCQPHIFVQKCWMNENWLQIKSVSKIDILLWEKCLPVFMRKQECMYYTHLCVMRKSMQSPWTAMSIIRSVMYTKNRYYKSTTFYKHSAALIDIYWQVVFQITAARVRKY